MIILRVTGDNLKAFLTSEDKEIFKGIKKEINKAENHILILAPFINPDILNYLLESLEKSVKVTIITTWNVVDLKKGVSRLDLYPYCKRNGYFLYLNHKVHLKAFIVDSKTCIFGSANISNNGMALKPESNYELMSNPVNIDIKDRIYFAKILKEAILVNDYVFNIFEEEVEDLHIDLSESPKIEASNNSDFLISSLPMTITPDFLFDVIEKKYASYSTEDIDCAIHDVVLFDLPTNISRQSMLIALKVSFFQQPFVKKLVEFIELSDDGVYFGELKEWVQKNCTDVPVPSRRSLTGNVKVLYRWLQTLGEGTFIVDRPNYSERIRKFRN